MDDLQIGDIVAAGTEYGTVKYDQVYGWLHRNGVQPAEFVNLSTRIGSISLSTQHLLNVGQSCCSFFNLVPAGNITNGDKIWAAFNLSVPY